MDQKTQSGTKDPIATTSLIATSEKAALIRVGSLENLKLEILSGDSALSREQIDSSEPNLREQSAAISYRGIYRGESLVFLKFNPSASPEENQKIQVRLSWRSTSQTEPDRMATVPTRSNGLVKRASSADEENDSMRLRIPITETGLYELSIGDVAKAAGIALESLMTESWGLELNATPVPFELTQAQVSTLSASDTILFYGIQASTEYTRTNIYWLNLTSQDSPRIKVRDGSPVSEWPTPPFFPSTHRSEEDSHLWQTMPGGIEADRWFFGDRISAPEQRSFLLRAPLPARTERAFELRVALQGLSYSAFHSPDHKVGLKLNGVALAEHSWDDRKATIKAVKIPAEILNDIDNMVSIEALGLPELEVDQFFLNWIELAYDRQFVAHEGKLVFGAPEAGKYTFQVDAYPDHELDLFDISLPSSPERIAQYQTAETENGHTLQFSSTATGSRQFLAQAVSLRRAADKISLDAPSNWKSPDNAADYIVISHEEFEDAAKELCAFRASQGLRTATVMIQDLYDEFSDGRFDPRAIRDFLSYAYHHWESPAPKYVVLMGDAYLDYLDRLNTESINYLPSQQISTSLLGLTISDNWYAQVDGDDKIPDLFLGRIPATSSLDAERFVERLIHYESAPWDEEWRSRAVFIADDDNLEFEALSDQLTTYLPDNFGVTKWYARGQGVGQSQEISRIFEAGHGLISYTGHGTVASWGVTGDGEVLLTTGHAGKLNPNERWPIVTTANCLNGFFAARHSRPSLAEALLINKYGGAIAVWAPTSLGFPEGHRILMKHFYEQVFDHHQSRIGPATTAAQIATIVEDPRWLELGETYVLFGDPAMRIRLGLRPKAPAITIDSISTTSFMLRYETKPDLDYTLFTSEDLKVPGAWKALSNGPHNSGSYAITRLDEAPSRFYRLNVMPKDFSIANSPTEATFTGE